MPRDKRGYPIPYAQYVDARGVPDFRVIDAEKNAACARRRVCFVCGDRLGKHVFFVGGPRCVAHGLFYNGPMHKECAEFAITTCPHLATAKGKYADTERVVQQHAGEAILQDRPVVEEKPEWFGLMHGSRYIAGTMNNVLTYKAELPWIDVVRYRDGKIIVEG